MITRGTPMTWETPTPDTGASERTLLSSSEPSLGRRDELDELGPSNDFAEANYGYVW